MANPYLIKKDTSGVPLTPVHVAKPAYGEPWLQELLRQHPDILPTGEFEGVFQPLLPIGREVATQTGSVDNLFISHRGYLVLIETKLWKNPEAKREVIAQSIDYGSSISNWSYGKLNETVRAYTGHYEGSEIDLADWVEQRLGPVEGGRRFFEDTVAKNLRLGRFLTLIVGDRIRESLVQMLSYIGKYPHLATDVGLVELLCYQWDPAEKWPLLIVPRVVARTEVVQRSIVQITLLPQGTAHQVEVRQEGATDEPVGNPRVSLTEEAFWELLRANAPHSYDTVWGLVDTYRGRDGITIDPKEGSLSVKLQVQDAGQQISLFFVGTNAVLHTWPGTVAFQLRKTGRDGAMAKWYGTQMREIFKMSEKRYDLSRPIAQVDIERFVATVDDLIEKIQIAEPTEQ